MENIKQLNNLEYKNSVNIRRKYCVTDKSDGERNLLFIDSKGELFLINREQEIKKTGVKGIIKKLIKRYIEFLFFKKV